jgi:hypothetical protein
MGYDIRGVTKNRDKGDGMKKIRVLSGILIASLFLVLSSCVFFAGDDGDPGLAYIGTWVNYTEADDIYEISTDALPTSFYYGLVNSSGTVIAPTTYYEVAPGSYDFSYQLHYYINPTHHYSPIISGSLTIAVNPGEPGKLFTDGANGADRYYDWILGWATSVIAYGNTAAPKTTSAPAAQGLNLQPAQNGKALDLSNYDVQGHSVETKNVGRFTITIDQYLYTPKGAVADKPKN